MAGLINTNNMKAKFLKIAGVKSEKQFYAKYPTESAFFKAHPEVKKELKKAQLGEEVSEYEELDETSPYSEDLEIGDYIGGEEDLGYSPLDLSQFGGEEEGYSEDNENEGLEFKKGGKKLKKAAGGFEAFAENMGGAEGMASTVGDIVQGVQMIKEQRNAVKRAKQSSKVSEIAAQAAGTRPQPTARRYVRPEDMLTNPNERFMSYGTGTNVLAEDGAEIGGNPTEIQNMYNPGDLYSDLGFEPLVDSDKMKNYKKGGKAPIAKGGFDLNMFAKQGGTDIAGQLAGVIPGVGQDAGSKIGGGVGKAAGTALFGPLGGMVGNFAGKVIGGLIDTSDKKIKKYNEQTQKNIGNMALQQGANALQSQYSSFMKDGGSVSNDDDGYEWISHTWQPQKIVKFGEYDVKDLLKPDETMDTLRTGGNIRQNNMGPQDQLSFGGEMKTHWGGYAEPISYNPYLPGTGETVMFRGQSHDESDGKGRTGIGVSYGDTGNDSYTDYAEYGTEQATDKADVEVERREPAIETQDANGEKSMLVYGNLIIPKELSLRRTIGDSALDGKNPIKFKNYVADLSKKEQKSNNRISKAVNIANDIKPISSFDKLALQTQKAIIDGENQKLKNIAMYKQNAAALQQAINDSAEELGLDADALAKGKTKIAKIDETAKFGTELEKAQKGGKNKTTVKSKTDVELNRPKEQTLKRATVDRPGDQYATLPSKGKINEKLASDYLSRVRGTLTKKHEDYKKERQEKMDKYMDIAKAIATQAAPLLRRPLQEDLDPSQILGELTALATNQLVPVQAQQYTPELAIKPGEISLQDQLNANQADFNAVQRKFGYSPEAMYQLAAQKYAANSQVLGKQFAMNQQQAAQVFNKNREILNDAKLKNLGLMDQQYQRQEAAKSNTKATFQEAMNSIANKTLQNKLENRTLATYANLFPQYGFTPDMRAISQGLTFFETPQVAKHGAKTKKSFLNSSIVKSYKG